MGANERVKPSERGQKWELMREFTLKVGANERVNTRLRYHVKILTTSYLSTEMQSRQWTNTNDMKTS